MQNEAILLRQPSAAALTSGCGLQHEQELRGLPPQRGLVTAEKIKGAEAKAADPDEAMRQRLRRNPNALPMGRRDRSLRSPDSRDSLLFTHFQKLLLNITSELPSRCENLSLSEFARIFAYPGFACAMPDVDDFDDLVIADAIENLEIVPVNDFDTHTGAVGLFRRMRVFREKRDAGVNSPHHVSRASWASLVEISKNVIQVGLCAATVAQLHTTPNLFQNSCISCSGAN